MIKVLFAKDPGGKYESVEIDGHSGYAPSGRDIICAAVSALAVNLVNSIETFTDDRMTEVDADEDGGRICIRFGAPYGDRTALLLDSFFLGLRSIADRYGDTYIRIIDRAE
ncbi:MAG: ribosomal-processing cysteine protease Prp [Lachnospiraceae bacterium]|jgi:uncharacterized protein YsxB (DUF464 family)|nr:ribosomal-processing cysteine protease Prp [Lachnospiraceae bacterium]